MPQKLQLIQHQLKLNLSQDTKYLKLSTIHPDIHQALMEKSHHKLPKN